MPRTALVYTVDLLLFTYPKIKYVKVRMYLSKIEYNNTYSRTLASAAHSVNNRPVKRLTLVTRLHAG